MNITFSTLKQIHIELTTKCQASCPMCIRNYHGVQENPQLLLTELSLEDFQSIINLKILAQIEHLLFCGNFGDPTIAQDLLPILNWIRCHQPTLRIDIHTNGSARTLSWWKELADTLRNDHCVYFALDGLEDTHSIYRIGTNFNKIIENAKAFISAGGNATWTYLEFNHNQHQVEDARILSQELGFKNFSHKVSTRYISSPKFPVLDKQNNLLYNIEPPITNTILFLDKEKIKNYKSVLTPLEISCKAINENSIYIDAHGDLWPCCYTGATVYQYAKPNDDIYQYAADNKRILSKNKINLKDCNLETVLNSNWMKLYYSSWEDNSLPVCAKVCGKYENTSINQIGYQYVR